MKTLAVLLLLAITGCKKENVETTVKTKEATETATPAPPTAKPGNDYDADGLADEAYVILIKEGSGNPVEDGTPSEYAVTFTTKKFPQLAIGCCDAVIVPEGDLNNDGAAELSVFQAPMNGCVYTMASYTLQGGKWKLVFEPFLVPTGCEDLSIEELENLVYKEKENVYFMDANVNDEDLRKNPKEVKLL